MSIKDKSIKEIQDLETNDLPAYLNKSGHTLADDERMIKANFVFIGFLRRLGIIKNSTKVLDIGCGTGWLVEMFRRKGYEAYGGDILPTEEMYKRFPQGKFLFFDIFTPPQDTQKYDFIFIRALGPVEKIADWQKLVLLPWIGNHLNDGGIFYFAHNSNGSGIDNPMRCNQKEIDIVDILGKTVGPVLYCNRLPKNMTFVVRKGTVNRLNDQAARNTGYILNLWKGPQKNILYWLVHGMPVLFLPSDDLAILNVDRKQWNLLDYIFIFRSYPLRTLKFMFKSITAQK